MALRNVVKEGDSVLRKKCKVVQKFDEGLWELLDDMKDTMYKNIGMGLAAPQVGVLKRVVVMEVNNCFFEMINPVITKQSGSVIDTEACLSVPNQSGMVERPEKLTVEFQDRFGFNLSVSGEGLFARCVCHELDHLDGVLYIDKLTKKPKTKGAK